MMSEKWVVSTYLCVLLFIFLYIFGKIVNIDFNFNSVCIKTYANFHTQRLIQGINVLLLQCV